MKLSDVVRAQFLTARYGVSVEETNNMAFFEFMAFVDLAEEMEKLKTDAIKAGYPHLADG